jgi:opacity protein-like surface antigen
MKTHMIKKFLLLLIAVFIFHFNGFSQLSGIGGGLILETGRPPFGLHVKGTYDTDFVFKKSRISADIGFMFPQTVNTRTYNRAFLNVDANYDFYSIEGFTFYAMAGLNFTYYNSTLSKGFLPGLTGGAGVFYNLTDQMKAYSEIKNTFFGYGEAALTVGLLFKL